MTDNDTADQLTQQEYQWCVNHLEEVTRRLDRVIELVEGTDAEDRNLRDRDSDLHDSRARARSALTYFQQNFKLEEAGDE